MSTEKGEELAEAMQGLEYTEGFKNWKMGYASAIAYFLFAIILVVTLIQWRGQKNWVNEE